MLTLFHPHRKTFEELLTPLGITINGDNPWDIQVHNSQLYDRLLKSCSLGLGESYMDGWWDAPALDQFYARLTKNKPRLPHYLLFDIRNVFAIAERFFNLQNKYFSKRVAEQHYDLGNTFYEYMLDKEHMQYTCAYWKNAKTLEQAQTNKLELICRKLDLSENDNDDECHRILELGSGFGGFARYATRNFNCEVVCYNISKEQIAYAREKNRGLPIETMEKDYRDAVIYGAVFDKVVSIGLMEHVGLKNYSVFMETAAKCLKDEGLFLAHTIGRHTSAQPGQSDRWINKYIFPGGHLPSAGQLIRASEPFFRLEDVHNIGHHYGPTLGKWFENFDRNWPVIRDGEGERIYHFMQETHKDWPSFKYDKGMRFYRMWKNYLLGCKGAFDSGSIDLYQFVFRKGNSFKKYESVR